ncbi:MAG: hypothetical protein ACOC1X_03015 [Promethearchaeota archaeon]
MAKECPVCKGEGLCNLEVCYKCNGTGEVELEDMNEIVYDVEWATCDSCGNDLAVVQNGRDILVVCRECDNHKKVI